MAKSYFWVNEEADGIKTVGLNDQGRNDLGSISFIDIPAVGTDLKVNDKFIAVEAEKAVTDIDSPVNGQITAVNEALFDNPTDLDSADNSKNWIVKVK